MATQEFKVAVNNAKFPFLFSRASRGVLQSGLDVAPRVGGNFSGNSSIDFNTVQILYCENVLPIAEGIMSVSTRQVSDPVDPPITDFDQLLILRDAQERQTLFSPARGQNYIYDPVTATWTSYNSFTWAAERTLVSRAYVDGRTFICYEGDRVIEWNPDTEVFDTIALTLPAGYTMSDIRGIASSANYLILHTETEILWSSLLDVTDFNNTDGGSGRQTPLDLKGQITCIIPISGGIVVYTNRNAVAGFATNNAAVPFTFREVQNSGGVAGYEQVTFDSNQAAHFTYGTSGLQTVTLQRAESIFPDCTDFLAGRQYEYWDPVAKTVAESTLLGALEVKLHYFDNRYLTISYGKLDGQFTFCLIFDTALQRWGKIRVNHIDLGVLPSSVLDSFDLLYNDLSGPYDDYDVAYDDLIQAYGDIVPIRAGIVFLQQGGALQLLISDPSSDSAEGVLLVGHIQVVRSRTVTFLGAKFDGVYGTPSPTVTLVGSAPGNGFDRDKIVATTVAASGEKRFAVNGRSVFENFDLAIEGKFNLTAGIVETMVHGSR